MWICFGIKFKQNLSSCASVFESIKRNSSPRTQLFWPKKRRFNSKPQPGHFTSYFKTLEEKPKFAPFFWVKTIYWAHSFHLIVFGIKFKQNLPKSSCPSVCENIKKIYVYEPNCFGQKNGDSCLKPSRVIWLHISRRWRKNQNLHLFWGKNNLLGLRDFMWFVLSKNLNKTYARCRSVCENIKVINTYEPNCFGQKDGDSPLKFNQDHFTAYFKALEEKPKFAPFCR